MPNNNTNLPILDDIIKAGDAGKAVHQPSSKVQSSILSADETIDSSTTRIYAETHLHTANDDRPDKVELYTDDQSANDAIDRMQNPAAIATDDALPMDQAIQQGILAGVEKTRPPAIDLPGIEALTEEIFGNLMPEVEQLLRNKIQQTLRKHFPDKTKPD